MCWAGGAVGDPSVGFVRLEPRLRMRASKVFLQSPIPYECLFCHL